MQAFRFRRIARLFLLAVILFSNCYFHVITLPILYHDDADPASGLWWGAFAYLINLVIGVTACFTRTENMKLLILLLILTVLGSIANFLHPAAGVIIFLLYLSQLPDCVRMRWVQQQQGYPYFNERYQLQKDYRAYTSQFMEETESRKAEKQAQKKKFEELVIFSLPDEKKHH